MMSESEKPTLTILGGPMAGTKFVLQEAVDNVLVGSDPSCGFCLPLPGVSPIHARLWVDLQGVTVYDTGSPRGLYVNDDRVVGQTVLHNGDILWLGAPGDADVVMIQCRITLRPETEASPPFVMPAPPTEPDTVVLPPDEPPPTVAAGPGEFEIVPGSPAPEPPPEPASVAPPPSDFEVVGSEAPTVVMPEPAESFQVVVPPEPPPIAPPVEPTPPPVSPAAPTRLPSVPAFFEDETAAEAAVARPPVAAEAPPAPHPPAHPLPPATATKPAAAHPAAPHPHPITPKPPAPRPTPPKAAHPVPHPSPVKAPAPPRSGAPIGRYAALGAVALVVIVGVAGGGWYWLRMRPAPTKTAGIQPPLPSTLPPTTMAPVEATTPSPETVATPEPTPTVEEAVTIVKPTPSPSPSPKGTASPLTPTPSPKASPSPKTMPTPKATPTGRPTQAAPSAEEIRGQQIASLLAQADEAQSAGRYDAAAAHYEAVLKLDPGNARANTGRSHVQSIATSLKKTFVAGRTSVQAGGSAAKKTVGGFESEDVSVAKATDYSGRIEFEVNPSRVKSGDSYVVRVYLVNDGKKGFKIGNLSIVSNTNGAKAGGGPVTPPAKDVLPQQRVSLQEVPGVWQEGVTSWNMDVTVATNRGDTFKNVLTWR